MALRDERTGIFVLWFEVSIWNGKMWGCNSMDRLTDVPVLRAYGTIYVANG